MNEVHKTICAGSSGYLNISARAVMKDGIAYGILTADDIAQHCGDYVDKSIRDIIRWSAPLGI